MTTLYIKDNTNTQYILKTNLSGSHTEYIAPGYTGTWTWITEKYGSDRRFGSFTPATGGNVPVSGTWVTDTGITETTQSAVALYTSINTLDQLYDYSGYTRLTDPEHYIVNKFGAVLDLGSTNLILNASAPTIWSLDVATNTLTVKSATLLAGTKFTSIKTTGSLTLMNGAQIKCLFTDSTGTSTNFKIENITAGSSVWLADNNGNTVFFGENQSGTVINVLPPSASGTWSWAVEHYGSQRQSNTFTPIGGEITVTVKDIFDVGITETSIATVLAYSNIDTLDKFYDVVASYRLTSDGIKMGQIATRSGASIELGSRGLLVKQSASTLISSSSNNITIRSNALLNGTKFTLIVSDPPKVIVADTNEIISAAIEDGNGDSSVTIQGGSGNFVIWKLANSVPEDDYATGTNLGPVGNVKFRFLHDDDSKLIIRDEATSFRQVLSMTKGIYTAGLYFGAQVQLAQQSEVVQINLTTAALAVDMSALKGAGFSSVDHSMVAVSTRQNKIIKKLKSIITAIFGLS